MHTLAITSVSLAAITLTINEINLRSDDQVNLGITLFFGLIYMFALALGIIGWAVSAIVLFRRAKTPKIHRMLAIIYIAGGAYGLSLAYYVIQAE